MDSARGLLGVVLLVSIAMVFSENIRGIRLRTVCAALSSQIVLGAVFLHLSFGVALLGALAESVEKVLSYGYKGSDFLFGGLVSGKMNELLGAEAFVFALHVLPSIVFVSAAINILYYVGVMQIVSRFLGRAFAILLGVTHVESLSAVSTIFLGQNDLPIAIKPYLKNMTRAELMCVMSSGVASIAGSMLAGYAGLGVRMEYLIAASFMAIPGGILYAKLLMPTERSPSETKAADESAESERPINVIEAAAMGATNGARIAISIATMLLAFVSLIALLNGVLSGIFGVFGYPEITIEALLGMAFAPLAYLIGVPWESSSFVGQLIGQKLVFNEFVAYISLSPYLYDAGSIVLDERTKAIASFALCGFANFTSIAVLLGCFGGLIPERRSEVAALGMRAVLAGTLSNLTSACIAGLFLI